MPPAVLVLATATATRPPPISCAAFIGSGDSGRVRSRYRPLPATTVVPRVVQGIAINGKYGGRPARYCVSDGGGDRASPSHRNGDMSLLPDSDGGISAQEQTQAIVNNGSEEESAVRRNKKLNDLEERQRKFTMAMTTLSSTRLWKAVPALIAEAGRVGLPLNVISVNAAMSAFSKSGRWMETLQLLSQMQRGTYLTDVCGAEAAIGGGGGGDSGGIASARGMRNVPAKVLDTVSGTGAGDRGGGGGVKARGGQGGAGDVAVTGEQGFPLRLPKPDVITYNIAISACGKGKQWQAAVELLKTMREEGLTPDGFSYTAAISACKRCGQWEHALKLVDEMRFQGLGKVRHSLNAAISACATAGQWKPALEILRRMEADGPEPDVFTYSSAIDACARGGKLDLALQTLKNMRDENSKAPAPNSVCYNVALQGLSREGRWREARQLLSGVASSTRLDYLSYNSVIRACAAAGMMDEALKTREEMSAAGVSADPFTYEALVAGYGWKGDWRAAESVVREMLGERNR